MGGVNLIGGVKWSKILFFIDFFGFFRFFRQYPLKVLENRYNFDYLLK